MITRLKNDHDRLRALANQLDVYLGEAAPPQGAEFPQLRWQLVRELSMHLALEQSVVRDWQSRERRDADELDWELAAAFTNHVVRWSGVSLAVKWDCYRAAACALLERLRSRMDQEERTMFRALRDARPKN